jgi:hypothetical protein
MASDAFKNSTLAVIRDKQIASILTSLKDRRVVVILDCCFAAGARIRPDFCGKRKMA